MMATRSLLLKDRLEHQTISIDQYRRTGGYEGLRELLNHEAPENIKKTVLDSGLQGRGGAGFPAGKKWQLLPDDAPHPRYIVANTDEMEPGTFKDRLLLSLNPHTVIEGMITAGYANSAQKGYFFIRPSYHLVATKIEKALDEARTAGFLGHKILGSDFSFQIVVHRSAGRYICGEAKGLIHALEGKRPHPTIEGHLTEEGFVGTGHHRQQRGDPGLCAPHRSKRRRMVPEPGETRQGSRKQALQCLRPGQAPRRL